VHDLAAKASDLDDRDTRFSEVEAREVDGRRLRIDPQQMDAVRVQLAGFDLRRGAAT
jgi:hypothetical protein